MSAQPTSTQLIDDDRRAHSSHVRPCCVDSGNIAVFYGFFRPECSSFSRVLLLLSPFSLPGTLLCIQHGPEFWESQAWISGIHSAEPRGIVRAAASRRLLFSKFLAPLVRSE